MGIEPTANSLKGYCSTTELLTPAKPRYFNFPKIKVKFLRFCRAEIKLRAMDILQKIVAHKKIEVENLPKISVVKFETRDFAGNLKNENLNLIAEIKPRSPRGVNFQNLEISKIAARFEKSGARAISVLCDSKFFGGSFENLKLAKTATKKTPILAKDFFIDERQISLARNCGADAILLIARILSEKKLQKLANFAHAKNLQILIEIFDDADLKKIENLNSDAIGVNFRNLKNFQIEFARGFEILKKLPPQVCKIAMSGFRGAEIKILKSPADAVLIGGEICKNLNKNFEQKIEKRIGGILSPKKLLKICGVRDAEIAEFCEKNEVHFCGFNFCENSKRKI